MKKKILFTVAVVALITVAFLGGRISVTNVNSNTVAPVNDATCSSSTAIPKSLCIDDLDLEPSGPDEDISPTMVKDIIIFNATVNDYVILSYSFPEGDDEPASIETKLFKDDYTQQVDVTVPNASPIYVWDGDTFIPAEAEVYSTYKAGKNGQQEEYHKWVFKTQDGKEYSVEKF